MSEANNNNNNLNFDKMEIAKHSNSLANGEEQRLAGGSQNDLDDEPDETVGERLWGLTEMFPESVRNFTASLVDYTQKGIQGIFKVTCTASWIFFTSAMILFAPVVLETERAQINELKRIQQKQTLLGPGAAISAVNQSGRDLPPIR